MLRSCCVAFLLSLVLMLLVLCHTATDHGKTLAWLPSRNLQPFIPQNNSIRLSAAKTSVLTVSVTGEAVGTIKVNVDPAVKDGGSHNETIDIVTMFQISGQALKDRISMVPKLSSDEKSLELTIVTPMASWWWWKEKIVLDMSITIPPAPIADLSTLKITTDGVSVVADELNGASVQSMMWKSHNGMLKIGNAAITSEKIQLVGDNGNIEVSNVNTKGSVFLDNKLGSVSAQNVVSEDVAIHTENKAIQVNSITAKKLTIDTVNGPVTLQNANIAESITATTMNTNIDISNVNVPKGDEVKVSGVDVVLQSMNGHVDLRNVYARSIRAQSDNGYVQTLDVHVASLTAHSGNGAIKGSLYDVQKLDATSTYGAIEFLPLKLADKGEKRVVAKSATGKVQLFMTDDFHGTFSLATRYGSKLAAVGHNITILPPSSGDNPSQPPVRGQM
ncbi:hypothetical protein HK102_007701, partial [Quaeritorhiza haematococci]